MGQRWPQRLWIVRHAQSEGNVARAMADDSGAEQIELAHRDVDIPLSAAGREQALALGRWFGKQPERERPDVLLASPYVRALDTARLFRSAGGCDGDEPICLDERLREKEFGILDGLTPAGIARREPQQAELRRALGKFYHRPPGGESWADVILRLRSLMDTLALHYGGESVMIFAHQVVVLCLRYILESMTEQEVLAVDKAGNIGNCAVTEYRFDPAAGIDGGLRLVRFNALDAMIEGDAPSTAEARHGRAGA